MTQENNSEWKFWVDKDIALSWNTQKGMITHVVRLPTKDDLRNLELKYPEWFETHFGGKKEIDTPDLSAERHVYLWGFLISEVKGYQFAGQKNWKDKVPPKHKILVVQEITKVKATDWTEVKKHFGKEALIDSENEIVYTVADQAGITLVQAHVFKTPTMNDIANFQRINSFTQQMKKNKLKFQSKPAASALCDMYDELIIEAHGYQDGQAKKPQEITTDIPALHKITAVKSLLSTTEGELEFQQGN